MYIFKVNGKEYKVRYSYRAVCEGDILDKVMNITNFDEATAKGVMGQLVNTTAELLLIGLQKYHSKEFGYKNDDEKQKRIDEMLDLFDDYEDESTEENPKSAATLLTDLQGELEKNGFLSAMMQMVQTANQLDQTAQETMTEMENSPARAKAVDMTPTESES